MTPLIYLLIIIGLTIYVNMRAGWKEAGREAGNRERYNIHHTFKIPEKQYPLPSEDDPFKVLKDYSPVRTSREEKSKYSSEFTKFVVTRLGPTQSYWKEYGGLIESKERVNDDYNTIIVCFYKTLLDWLYIKIDFNSESKISRQEKAEFLVNNQHLFKVSVNLLQAYLECVAVKQSQDSSYEERLQANDSYRQNYSEEERTQVVDCLFFLDTTIYASINILKSVNKFISEFHPSLATKSLKVKCGNFPPVSPSYLHYEIIQIIGDDIESKWDAEKFIDHYDYLYKDFIPKEYIGHYYKEMTTLGVLYFKTLYNRNNLYENPWPIIANFHEALIRIGNEHKAEKYAEKYAKEFPELTDTKTISNLSSDEFNKVNQSIWMHESFIRNFELELMKNSPKVPRELREKPWTKGKLDRIKAINKIELDAYNKLQEQRRAQERQEREREAVRKKQREKELKLERHYIGEGHYRNGLGEDYMSIWTYKRKNRILGGDNYKEALQIYCDDKFNGPFNQSNDFTSGWMYNTKHLDEFYKR